MFGYIYKTTNLVNGKIYIGQHKSEYFDPINYIGSGTMLRKAIEKYGKDNFTNELLCECISQNDMDKKEIFFIKKYNSTDKNIGYNITPDGFGGSGPMLPNTKEKIRAYNLGKTIVHRDNQCIKIDKNEIEHYRSLGYKSGPIPYTRSEEFKKSVSETNTGKIGVSKGNIKTRVKKSDLADYLNNGYIIGWITPELRVGYVHKKVPGIGPSKYMNKNNEYKLVPQSEQENYLADGWVYGGKKGRKKFVHKTGYKLSAETRRKLSESHKKKENH